MLTTDNKQIDPKIYYFLLECLNQQDDRVEYMSNAIGRQVERLADLTFDEFWVVYVEIVKDQIPAEVIKKNQKTTSEVNLMFLQSINNRREELYKLPPLMLSDVFGTHSTVPEGYIFLTRQKPANGQKVTIFTSKEREFEATYEELMDRTVWETNGVWIDSDETIIAWKPIVEQTVHF